MISMAVRILLLAVAGLCGCATVQVSQDFDPQADLSRYGTWRWREPVQARTGDIRIDNPLLDKRIRRAVETHLAGRGIKIEQQADLFLTYHLTIQQKIEGDTYYSTMGVGSFYNPWYGGFGTETRIRQYEEGRLTIDIHAADSGDLVWRGVGTYLLKTHKTPQEATAAVQHTVDKILFQFPPGPQP